MILAASGVTGLAVTLLVRMRALSAAAQLTLRSGELPQQPARQKRADLARPDGLNQQARRLCGRIRCNDRLPALGMQAAAL